MFWNWFGLTSPKRRALFAYSDGRRRRLADPIAVEVVFTKRLGHDWPEVVRELAVPLPLGLVGEALDRARDDRMKKHDEVVAAICEAFGVQEFGLGNTLDPITKKPGAGLGGYELFDLLHHYQLAAVELMELARPFANTRQRDAPIPENPQPVRQSESTSVSQASVAPAPAS